MAFYYPLYFVLYLLSLLPLRVLYLLSDGIYYLLYHVFAYRRSLVDYHLSIAFPEAPPEERNRIARQFYQNFCDVWVELLKMMSMRKSQAQRFVTYDFDVLEPYYKQGKSVQLYAGHFMNWEFVNLALPLFQPFPLLAVYMPLTNKVMERLVFNIRNRFGSILIKAGNLKVEMQPWLQKQYMMILAADQSPSNLDNANWLYYLNQPTAFIDGPWKKAVALNQPSFFLHLEKIKRGKYHFSIALFEEQPAQKTQVELLQKFVTVLEKDIHRFPAQYLWTHKRWKKKWQPQYAAQWVDAVSAAPEVAS